MLLNLAVAGYRSIRELALCLGQLNIITGPNGSGKSSLYRALQLLAETARGELIQSLAREGGLQSSLWAGPESFSAEMLRGEIPVQGGKRKKPVSLRLGFTSDAYCYTIDLGLPVRDSQSAFQLDPMIKRECLWSGPSMRPRELIVDRRNHRLRFREYGKPWQDVEIDVPGHASMVTEFSDPRVITELYSFREAMRSWRFYDHFRTDSQAPARQSEVGTFSPVLANDGSNLAAALQTVLEIGDRQALVQAIERAFPGAELQIDVQEDHRFTVLLRQHGMLRPLRCAELSDGTLRFLLLVAALLTPRPPELMVLNEPETSLHPDLIPALARLIRSYAEERQIFVVTHSDRLLELLQESEQAVCFQLGKVFGATEVHNVDRFDRPQWKWPAR